MDYVYSESQFRLFISMTCAIETLFCCCFLYFSFYFFNFSFFFLNSPVINVVINSTSIRFSLLSYRTSQIFRFSSTEKVKKFPFAVQFQIKLPRIELNRRFWWHGFVGFVFSPLIFFFGFCVVCMFAVCSLFIHLISLPFKFKHMKILNMHRDVFGARESKKVEQKGWYFS